MRRRRRSRRFGSIPSCPDCQQRVIWARTVAGENQALEPTADDKGNVLAYRDEAGQWYARSVSATSAPALGHEQLYMPHKARCPGPRQPALISLRSAKQAPPRPAPAARPGWGQTVLPSEPLRLRRVDAGVDLELLCTAAELVIRTQYASISVLMHRLRVPFVTAVRLIELMGQAGIVDQAHTASRDVLVPAAQLPAALAALREEASPDA